MQSEKQGKKDGCKRWLGALYLLLALLALGRVCVICYPEKVDAARAYLGGRTAQAFSALSEALGEGKGVREVFSDITGNEG